MPLGGRGHPSEGPTTKRRKPAEVSPGSPLFPEVGQGCASEPPGRRRQHEARGRVRLPSGGAQPPAANLQLGVGYLLQSRSLTPGSCGGGALGRGWAPGPRKAGKVSLTYVHTLLLRTSGGPRCSRSRGPGGGHRRQPPCSCPRAAVRTSCSTRSRP